MKIHNSLNYK